MKSGTNNSHVAIPNTNIEVCKPLFDLVINEILPDLGIAAESYWKRLEDVVTEMAPKNNILLLKRYQLQAEINTWHQARCDTGFTLGAYTRWSDPRKRDLGQSAKGL